MNTRKVVKNAGWIIGCKLFKAVLSLLITMLTARYMGPSNYGLINYAAGIVAFAAPVMRLGLDAVLVHMIVKHPEHEGKTVGTAIVLNSASALMCIVGVTAFAAVVNKGEADTIIVCALYSTLLLFQALEMIQYWFQAKLMAKYSAMAMVFAYICVSTFQILLLITQSHIYWFALSHAIDFLIISIVLIIVYRKKAIQPLKFSADIAKELLSEGKYYILSSLMITVFQQIANIMLKLMIGNESVGYYSAAATCASMASFVFAAVIDSMRPMIFEAKNRGKDQFDIALTQLYSIVIYAALMVSFLMCIASPLIIKIVYGAQYASSVNALRIVCWFTAFSYTGTINNIWIVVNGKQKYLLIVNLCGAISNIILNMTMIPLLGIIGASIATVCTQFFTNIIVGFFIKPLRENNMLIIKSLNVINIYKFIRSFFCNDMAK